MASKKTNKSAKTNSETSTTTAENIPVEKSAEEQSATAVEVPAPVPEDSALAKEIKSFQQEVNFQFSHLLESVQKVDKILAAVSSLSSALHPGSLGGSTPSTRRPKGSGEKDKAEVSKALKEVIEEAEAIKEEIITSAAVRNRVDKNRGDNAPIEDMAWNVAWKGAQEGQKLGKVEGKRGVYKIG